VSETINWSVAARANAGPTVTANNSMTVDAYDKLEVTIANGATDAVNIAPVAWTKVQFLALSPKQPSAQLTYQAGGGSIAIDGPHFLVGAGAVALLGTGNAILSITNSTGADAVIDILVGRKAS
jgi:hypothetical protein